MQLNLPAFEARVKNREGDKKEIFDLIRKKFVNLTPEEWVRQHFIHFLIHYKKYPASLIAVEKGLKVNQMSKRFDAVVHNKQGKPCVLVEFKSPDVKLSQATFDQIAAYNLKLKVKYLIISNGLEHYCTEMDYSSNSFRFLKEIPDYSQL